MNEKIVSVAPIKAQERFEFGKYANQADGAVWFREGANVLLAAVTYEEAEESDDDFLPLTVQYIEKTYAAGKFPGGFLKRESKLSDFETLTSRIIDRALRPLFPKGLTTPILIVVTVLSCDSDADLQRLAVLAASAALFVSSLPARKAISAVRIGRIDDHFVVNPTLSDMEKSTLDLFVCGSADELLMIEMRAMWANSLKVCEAELPEDKLLEAIALAQENVAKAAKIYDEAFAFAAKETKRFALKSDLIDEAIAAHVAARYDGAIKEALVCMSKSERGGALKEIVKQAAQSLETDDLRSVELAVEARKRFMSRKIVMDEDRRADGRALDEIRPILIETNLLPKAHGSALFTRGQTQALAIVTLGGDSDRQGLERLTDKTHSYEKFMLHYNFPGFSVGETKRIGAPGRRELGHGNLAKRAIECQISPDYENAIRVVSEILESNGSSSMATVCGASMALKAAAVPLQKLVAGVAMGLMTEGERHKILTDITGLEDHDGDMDFKVAGTQDGVSALQMDIKLGGLPLSLLAEALERARVARLSILEKMQSACDEIVVNKSALPGFESFNVDPKAIGAIIGKGGAVITELCEKYGVKIDLDKDGGGVKVRGADALSAIEARNEICRIAEESAKRPFGGGGASARTNAPSQYAINQELEGVIVKIVDFGLFVELPDGSQGLVHISKAGANGKRIAKLSDHFKEGDRVVVIFEGQDERKKIALNLRDKIAVD
ncbi:MAG: polyribonucleotide nucleotidyltransferase [Helicobacteraceae bacterium]|jgi:polyribonucleotide nucleotidyltransferase|nr:polyribonucleotide nucleotidyltransferase [Helicobacteraceae bacterium]